MKAKYVHPYTNFGFRKLFGKESSKDLVKDFLNQLLPDQHRIVKITAIRSSEQWGVIKADCRFMFDIYCENEREDTFIVEIQKAKYSFFENRDEFYHSFPLRDLVDRGNWDFSLKPVYCLGILDFVFKDDREQKLVQYFRMFLDKIPYIIIEMPRFNKTEIELESHLDKWLYFFKHLEDFEEIPGILKEDIFIKAFEAVEISKFDQRELDEYEESLKVYRDLKAFVETAFEEAAKRKALEIAKNALEKGVSIDFVAEITGLSKEDIEKL